MNHKKNPHTRSYHKQHIKNKVITHPNSTRPYPNKIACKNPQGYLNAHLPTTQEKSNDLYTYMILLLIFGVYSGTILLAPSSTIGSLPDKKLGISTSSTVQTFNPILLQMFSYLFSISWMAKKSTSPIVDNNYCYQSIDILDITTEVHSCEKKRSGISAGKICYMNDAPYYLKTINPAHVTKKSTGNALLGQYNVHFLESKLKVQVPNTAFVYEKDGCFITDDDDRATSEFYLASKAVTGLILARDILKKADREYLKLKKNLLFTQSPKMLRRQYIAQHIGEEGIAQLAVSGTLFQDLIMNDGNWGANKYGLVILDVDFSPGTLEEYLIEAVRVPYNIELDFSLNTIRSMLDHYERISAGKPPQMHPTIDMSSSFYKILLDAYIRACQIAIKTISRRTDIIENKPSQVINDILSNSFSQVLKEIKQKKVSELYPRYDIHCHNIPITFKSV